MSFIETTQEATTDFQDKHKSYSQRKNYSFFIFYQKSIKQFNENSFLQTLDFKIKQTKSSNLYQNKLSQSWKYVQLHFYNVDFGSDILNAISDIKNHCFENKTKIIVHGSQSILGSLISQFDKSNLDINNIPFLIISNNYKSDISSFLGWDKQNSFNFLGKSLTFYQQISKKWIKSGTQKIDVWTAQIKVSEKNGRIFKFQNDEFIQLANVNHFAQTFVSHLTLGFHASLSVKYKQKIKSSEISFLNSFIQHFQAFKKFCCIGSSNLKETTGVVNILLTDQKGEELQLLKNLKPHDSSQQQSQIQFSKNKKGREYNDVVSVVFANIDKFHSQKIDSSIQRKIHDERLQLITFSSYKQHRKICSSKGQIKIKLETERLDLQIGQSIYKLQNPIQIRIGFAKKIKIGINNEFLSC